MKKWLHGTRKSALRLLIAVGLTCIATGLYGLMSLDKVLFGVYSAAARDTNLVVMLVLFGGALCLYAAFELGISKSDVQRKKTEP